MDIVSYKNNRYATPFQRCIIYVLDQGKCHYCHIPIYLETFHADHVVPWFKSHDTSLSNLVASCWLCNKSKGVMDYDRFIYKLATKDAGWRRRRHFAIRQSYISS